MNTCTINKCSKPYLAKGMCSMHWSRNKRHGDVNYESREFHGLYGTTEYNSWVRMKDRCINPKNNMYKYYGAKGIKVCDRWIKSFVNFSEDMGNKPTAKHSLDRINSAGNYEPSNCRWATAKEQSNNTSRNVVYIFQGLSKTLAELSHEYGLKYKLVYDRVHRYGWSLEKALEINNG